jgi:hypothetical protein
MLRITCYKSTLKRDKFVAENPWFDRKSDVNLAEPYMHIRGVKRETGTKKNPMDIKI